ncbi:bifunctional phosphoribosylaminoimidazolecarboxamide formyltransferase/IMP cyclohydrolase [candidate division KSB1 bacterium 4484_87]|nr:MAG: bifunctional phosphoribosylaminoimidazolecarboxamide formyltransferase/IMP cyclohydrolase [candidate division KSB1 bacterium 4484_87]
MNERKVRRALISVYDKTDVVEFARELTKLSIEIISTGGTATLLRENGIECIEVAEITGAPEMLDGRVKTLHPFVHGAILAKRDNPEHVSQLDELNIKTIDLIVVNLYPFEKVIQQQGTTLDVALENIDIGGPTMIRAAAKNFPDVAVVTSADQYADILDEMKKSNGALAYETRKKLAIAAFQRTNEYDGIIYQYLQDSDQENKPEKFPKALNLNLAKVQDLRYGENPHQGAAFYRDLSSAAPGLVGIEQLHGKELSFNNLMDLDAVVRMVKSFDDPCSVIVKHSNPCGVAIGDDLHDAFVKAFATDSLSAFGGIYGFNRTLNLETAEELRKIFIEVIVAPDFEADALQLLSKKKNLRILKLDFSEPEINEFNFKRVAGGLLVQDEDLADLDESKLRVVSQRKPTTEEMEAMKFAWKVVKWVKSNAIVFCQKDRTIGIGAGQMSRVDASQLAIDKAGKAGLSLQGSVLASDAFFPFRDGVDVAAKAGATAIIQPGGSVRDEEVIEAVNGHGMSMVFTGIRHFRH